MLVSPHLDDAVLSCGDLIAALERPRVVTVFAGTPADSGQAQPWDLASGFRDAAEAMAARRVEDGRALALLGAIPLRLGFCDSQYGCTPALAEVESALLDTLDRVEPDSVVLPAGLFHSDHRLVHDAMLSLLRRQPGRRWLMYEEAMYRRIQDLLPQRLGALREAGFAPEGFDLGAQPASARKREALQCYASQLRALSATVEQGWADALEPERCWRLHTPTIEAGGPG